jgi:hypothetical protein
MLGRRQLPAPSTARQWRPAEVRGDFETGVLGYSGTSVTNGFGGSLSSGIIHSRAATPTACSPFTTAAAAKAGADGFTQLP